MNSQLASFARPFAVAASCAATAPLAAASAGRSSEGLADKKGAQTRLWAPGSR